MDKPLSLRVSWELGVYGYVEESMAECAAKWRYRK
jgi:hypothetical protein